MIDEARGRPQSLIEEPEIDWDLLDPEKALYPGEEDPDAVFDSCGSGYCDYFCTDCSRCLLG